MSSSRLDRTRPVRALAADSSGAGIVEYLAVLGLIALAVLGAFTLFGTQIVREVTAAAACFTGTGACGSGSGGGAGGGGATACTSGTCVGGSSCFLAGTLVATTDGAQPIELIRAGDAVLTFDEATGETRVSHVAATFETKGRDVLSVHLRGVGEPIRVTPGHRFFTLDRGWVGAETLTPDEPLVDADGVAVLVDAVDPVDARATVYNFEVEETHTYFVSNSRVLVHNPMTDVSAQGYQLHAPVVGNQPLAIIVMSSTDPTVKAGVQALLKQHPDARIVPVDSINHEDKSNFNKNALSGIGDVMVVGHGAENPNLGPGYLVVGEPGREGTLIWDGEDLGMAMKGAGYKPGKAGATNPELFVVACSSGKGCATMPSVAQNAANTLGQTAYGLSEPGKIVDLGSIGVITVNNGGTVHKFGPQPPTGGCTIQ